MVIKELLHVGKQALNQVYQQNSLSEAYSLLAHIFKKNRTYLMTHQDEVVSNEIIDEYHQLIRKRNKQEPLAYLTGEAYFMDLSFYVNEQVLIPRADSEILIEQLLLTDEKKEVLDLCCGSGVLGITYATYFNKAAVLLSDISEGALSVAAMNIHKHQVENRVSILQSNLFEGINNRRFDLIISNPPYIASAEICKLMDSVKDYEPHLALNGGIDGLDFYRKIIYEAKEFLNKRGMLALEIGWNQKAEVVSLLQKNSYSEIKVYQDNQQRDRIIIAYY